MVDSFFISFLLFILGPFDFAGMASSYYELLCVKDNSILKEAVKQMTSLFGMQPDHQEDKKITEAMQIGQLAQPLIAARADVHASVKGLFVTQVHKLVADGTLHFTDGGEFNLEEMTLDAITIDEKPGISILRDIQSMAATPDMKVSFRHLRMTIEMKTTADYNTRQISAYVPQCQMEMLCVGAIVGLLLLVDSANMTLKNVSELARCCDIKIHVIPRNTMWQREAIHSCLFVRALSELVVPQLYSEAPFAPNTMNKALLFLSGAFGTVTQRNGRTLRLSGCRAEATLKHVSFDVHRSEYPPVRHSAAISIADATAINMRIKSHSQTGVYLIASQLDHVGCPAPISADKQYSVKEWSDILDDIADLKKKGLSIGSLILHLNKRYRLKKTPQDVTNLLSKMEIVKQFTENKVLPSNAVKLIDALDTMPVVSVSLYHIVKCDAAHTLVMEVIRVKGYVENKVHIAYLEYQDWTLLKASIQHSLMQMLEDPTLPFIGTPIIFKVLQPYTTYSNHTQGTPITTSPITFATLALRTHPVFHHLGTHASLYFYYNYTVVL